MCDHGSERLPEAALDAFWSHFSLETFASYFGALLEYLSGSALSVVVLALLALLALAFEPNHCKNLSSVSLSGPWQVSLPLLLRLSERAKRASEGITWPARCLLML